MPKALVLKPETVEMFRAILGNLPEIKTGYVRLIGPSPDFVYEEEFQTQEDQTTFLIQFGLARLGRVSAEDWMSRKRDDLFAEETLKEAEYLLKWAQEYHRLAQEAVAQ